MDYIVVQTDIIKSQGVFPNETLKYFYYEFHSRLSVKNNAACGSIKMIKEINKRIHSKISKIL